MFKKLELSELGENMGGLSFSFVYDVASSCDVDEKTEMSNRELYDFPFAWRVLKLLDRW